jgi:glycosyltransferase involved in cell wall biosynthesis
MKVIHVSTALSWRGGEQQIAYLVDELSKKNIEQLVICTENSAMESFCKKNHLPFRSFSKNSGLDFRFAYHLSKAVKAEKPNIVHLHDAHAHTAAIIGAIFFGIKTPFILHRRVDFEVGQNIFSRFKYRHPQIKKIVCVSAAIKNIMAKSVAFEKLITVHSATDCSRFSTTQQNILRNEFNIPAETKIIANIAALAPHKDYPTFLKTVSVLKLQNLNAKYLIIGEGSERKNIEQLITELQLHQDVILTGFRNDIDKIFPEIDLLLFTSETEGLGTTVLDAFYSKVPVVATNAGGISEMIEHEKTGLLSNLKDYESLAANVQRIFVDDALRNSIIKNASAKVQQFSKATMAEKVLAVYKEVLNA